MNRFFLIILMFGLAVESTGQVTDLDTLSYEEFDVRVSRLFQAGDFSNAIIFLETAKEKYPEKYAAISWDLALNYFLSGRYEEALKEMESGINKGIWYGYDPNWDIFDTLSGNESFIKLLAIDTKLKEKAQAEAKAELLVELPANYSPDSLYPLFIALHGWGQNNEEFREKWTSDRLKDEFITAYIQSSQVADMDGFGWTDSEQSMKDIKKMYYKILSEYTVDTTRMYVGGFSQGGKTSIRLILDDEWPLKGFIALCPGIPDNLSDEAIKRARAKKKKGVLILGETDRMIEQQMMMKGMFRTNRFGYKVKVKRLTGHEFPKDFKTELDSQILFID